jgi:Na+/H+-translocating membrane pyrophosphatase
MESIAKSDIFFFITSISVVIITVIGIIAGYYIIQTLRNVRDISKKIKQTVDDAESTLGHAVEHITESRLFGFIFGKKKKRKEK